MILGDNFRNNIIDLCKEDSYELKLEFKEWIM